MVCVTLFLQLFALYQLQYNCSYCSDGVIEVLIAFVFHVYVVAVPFTVNVTVVAVPAQKHIEFAVTLKW